MAKLYLKFEQAVLKEIPLGAQGVVTIGRMPDNHVHIDNLAVSGHHARIYWEADQYIIEDLNSTNGTFVNNRRISKAPLKDEDQVLVGKHTLLFKDSWHDEQAATPAQERSKPAMPSMDATVMVGAKQAQELISASKMAALGITPRQPGAPDASGAAAAPAPAPEAPPRERIGTVSVIDGKTDHPNYVLSGKLSVIGKSDMASIKLKGWFAPKVAAVISRRDGKYFIASQDKDAKVKINGELIAGQKELTEGDVIEVAGVKMTFGFQE